MKKFLQQIVLAALMMPLGLHATTSTLTVADGTATNAYVPVYGNYTDLPQHSQMIYPAWMLEDMDGLTITGLSFFVTGGWTCPATVRMAIVPDTVLTGLIENIPMVTVWSGPLSSVTSMQFSNPFAYSGGNLLVDIVTEASSWDNSVASGIVRTGASYLQCQTGGGLQNFLPKAQFTYTDEPVCFAPVIDSVLCQGTVVDVYFHTPGTPDGESIRISGGTWDDAYTSPYTFYNLDVGTVYTIEMVASCDGVNSAVASYTFTTQCGTINTLPYTENFENFTPNNVATSYHPCWARGGNGGDIPYISTDVDQLFSNATKFLYLLGEGGDTWAVMPAVDNSIEMSDLELSLYVDPSLLATEPFYAAYFSFGLLVGVIDAPNYSAGVHIDTIAYWPSITSPETKYVSFVDYTGNGHNIIFFVPFNSNMFGSVITIDNIDLHYLPQCDRPDSLVLVDTDSTSLSLAWSASPWSTDFYLEWRAGNTGAWNDVNVVGNDYYLTGLTPNTLYNVRVRTVCGNDTSIAATGQFRTPCTVVTTFPWTESFESENTFGCWSTYDYDNYAFSNWVQTSETFHSGNFSAFSYYNEVSSGGSDWLVSPALDMTDNIISPFLSWYVLGEGFSGSYPHYSVRVSTSSATDTSTFTTLFEETRNDGIGDLYTKRSLSLAPYVGEVVYIAFVRDAGDDYFLSIDEVSVAESLLPVVDIQGTANPVLGVAATYVAVLDEGSSSGLTYAWHSARAAAGAATMTVGASDTVTMLYTTAAADTLRLIATNAYGADTAFLVINPLDINYTALPFSTGFEAGDDNNWTFANAGTNDWVIDTATHYSGARSLYISSDNGQSNTYTGSYAYSFAYRAFDFTTAGEYGLSFDWHNRGENNVNYDFLRVYLVPLGDTIQGSDAYSSPVGSDWQNLTGSLTGSTQWQNYTGTFDVAVAGIYNLVFYWFNDPTGGNNPPAAVDNLNLQAISCTAPTAFAVDTVTTTSATFSWHRGNAESSWQVQVGSLAPVVVSDTFYTLANLTPATHYDVTVRGICGTGDTSLVLGGDFWTECAVYQVPYEYGFQGGVLNPCWINTTVTGSGISTPSHPWGDITSSNYISSSAPYSLNPTSDYLISPAITIPTDTTMLRLTLHVMGYASTIYPGESEAKYEVLVSPTGSSNVADFTDTLWVEVIGTNNLFFSRCFPVGNYTGATIRFAIHNMSKRYGEVYLRDAAVRYMRAPRYNVHADTTSIAGDTNLCFAEYVEGVTTGMSFSWTSQMATAGQATMLGANTDTMRIVYSAAGVDTVTFIAYNSYGNDTTRFPVHVTVCNVISTFPWIENFEDANAIACWWQEGPAQWTLGSGTSSSSVTTAHSGIRNVRIVHTSSGNVTRLISPIIDLSAVSTPQLSFWHVQQRWSGDQDTLKVYYRTASNNPWHLLAAYDSNLAAWTPDTLLLPNPSATYQIAFEMVDDYGHGIGIDDITIELAVGPCEAPIVVVIDTTETSISISINGTAVSYEVAYMAGTWTSPTTGTAVSGSTYTFNNLVDGTAYSIGVRGVCGSDNYSTWTVVNVTTPQHPCIMPSGLAVTELTSNGGTIVWNASEAGYTDYEVNIYTTTDNDTILVSGATTHTFQGLYPGTSYSVRVRTVCSATNHSEWTAPVVLTPVVCPKPTNVVAVAQGGNINVTWDDMQVNKYRVEWYEEGFTTNGHSMIVTTNSATITENVESGQAYDIYVYAYCSETAVSEASNKVTVEITGINGVDASHIALYPNPASTKVTIDGIEGEATVTVVDMNGRTVFTASANDNLTIDLRGYAKGAYFVRIAGERTMAIRKLVVK